MKKLLLLTFFLSALSLYGQKTPDVIEKGKIEEMARLETVFIQTEDASAREIIVNSLLKDGRLKVVENEQDAQVIINYTTRLESKDETGGGQMQVMIRIGIDSPEKKTRRVVWTSVQKQDARSPNSPGNSPLQAAVTKFINDLNKVKTKKTTNVRDDPYKITVQ